MPFSSASLSHSQKEVIKGTAAAAATTTATARERATASTEKKKQALPLYYPNSPPQTSYQKRSSSPLALPTMDSFSLLSYWRAALSSHPTNNPDLIATEDDDDDDDDDASFFDLEFSQAVADADAEVDDEASDDENAFGLDLASDASSPPHDLFLKPSSTIVFETDSKPSQFPASLLKSATKLRVLMLAFKKAKGSTAAASAPSSPKLGKYFIKFKVEEVPIVSFFTRDSSAKTKPEVTTTADSDEKKLSKDVVLKYLNKIKPLYMRVSRRYLEKLIGERSSSENPQAPLTNVEKDSTGVIPTGLRVVRKKLKKSRSASSATAPPSPPRRRDDSLIEQQDGIQNAIAHCKLSFNKESQSSRSQGSESPLIRSLSDPGEC
ncbi:probable membrane-associated kinase regulator 2 [Dioscorea cayenensis subsp. rotundata]|uniref:Probable membrane-associated kinase regulator 2 n=1 Tax=Dioscorea cayennensis subsp. rotundata TaxID=55577 RepID=A0AB40BFL3_DIOCR|nr:probable membrane-associated kinase regulator 2 [Dioscorea cayenensis subsp. rotundata]